MKSSAVWLVSIFALSLTQTVAAATTQLKSFAWRDRVIANYEQLATVVRSIDSVADADDLIQAARRRGNLPSALGLVLDRLAPKDQDQFVANFRIDHPILGNHAYSRRVSPAYRGQLERLVEKGLLVDFVADLVGYVPELYGFGLTTLRERIDAFEGADLDMFEAIKWVIEAESNCEGRHGRGDFYRQERFMRNFVHWSWRLDDTDSLIKLQTEYQAPIDELLKTRAQILRRLLRYGSDPKVIEKARRRGIELEIANLQALQNAADGEVEDERSKYNLRQRLHNDRFAVRFGLVAPNTAVFDPASVRDLATERARAERLTELRAQLERVCSQALGRVDSGGTEIPTVE